MGLGIATATKAGNWYGHDIIRWTFDKLRHIYNFNFTYLVDRFSPNTQISVVWFMFVFQDACQIRKCWSALKRCCFPKATSKNIENKKYSVYIQIL